MMKDHNWDENKCSITYARMMKDQNWDENKCSIPYARGN